MAQFVVPIADLDNTGVWTTAPGKLAQVDRIDWIDWIDSTS